MPDCSVLKRRSILIPGLLGEEHCPEGEGNPKTSAQWPEPVRSQLAASVHGFSLEKENVAFSTTTGGKNPLGLSSS